MLAAQLPVLLSPDNVCDRYHYQHKHHRNYQRHSLSCGFCTIYDGFYYKAYVTSEDDPGMTFETPFTKHEYEKGDSVKIHYDPDDMSDY